MSNDRKEPPWTLWNELSKKAESLDTININCEHSFYWIPYSIDYLIKSKVSLKETCHDQHCSAIDEYLFEKDILHQPRFQPKPIRAVNKDTNLVVNRQGIVQGPYTHAEWLAYSWFLWDQFHEVVDNTVNISDERSRNLWASLYFRHTDDFCGGNYNFFSGIA